MAVSRLLRRAFGVTCITLSGAGLVPGAAAQILTESEAVDRALAQTDIRDRDTAERDAASARAAGVSRFDNPEAVLSRDSVSGAAGDETEWQAGIAQPIDIWGARASRRRAAQADARATDAEIAWRRREYVAEVRTAYVGCALAAERASLANGYVDRLRRVERIVSDRAETGDTAVYDLRRLRVELRTAQSDAASATGEVEADCAALGRLTGLAAVRPAQSLSALLNPQRVAGQPTGRADIAALGERLVAAMQRVQAAERDRLPVLRLGVGYKRIEAGGVSSAGPALSLGATIPLFNGGGAAVREARADAKAREAELSIARRRADAERAAAAVRARAAAEAARIAIDARDDAGRLEESASKAYQFGETGVVELIDAHRTARDAELNILERAERAATALIQLDLVNGDQP